MRKTRLLWLAIAAIGAVTLAIYFSWYQVAPASKITKAQFDRLEIGMTRAEMQGILGHHNPPDEEEIEPPRKLGLTRCQWRSERVKVDVVLDANDRIITKEWWRRVDDGFLERALRFVSREPRNASQWLLVP